MNPIRCLLPLILLIAPLAGRAKPQAYTLPATPMELATDEGKFQVFAQQMRAEVERLLGVPAMIDDRTTLMMLLASRVHLAHHFGDDEKAVATAAWIRSLQTDPSDKAFAGLTTLAAVEARHQHPAAAPGDAAYRATFARELARWLAPLPRTPEIVAMLRRQRDKNADMSEAALLAEVREVIIPAISRRGYCSFTETDQLVRVRHRLVSILPLRTETLAVLDEAIAARSSP